MPGILDSPMSEIYFMVNFWKVNNFSPEELAEIGRSLTGKTDPNTYTKADWINVRYHLSSLLP